MNPEKLSTKAKITWCPGCPNSQILVAFRQAVIEMVAGDEFTPKEKNLKTMEGAYVGKVGDNSAAKAAGVKEGDIINNINMERKYKILVAAAILVVLVVIGEGVMILNLQKNMSRLISPGNEGTNSSASNETSQAAKQNAPDYLVKAKQDELGALHDVGGTIVSFSDNQVGVQASVPDLAKLKDLTADDLNKPVDSFPQMEKTFKVNE